MALVAKLNGDPTIDGILVQLPLPPQIEPQRVIDAIDPAKDVDGFTHNVGRLWSGGHGAGAVHALWLPDAAARDAGRPRRRRGRGDRPLQHRRQADGGAAAGRELHRHRRAFEAAATCRRCARRAEILVAAVGRPEMVRGDWIKPGATVIDVGINRVAGAGGKSRWSATSPLPKRKAWPGRSRRCRAASAR